MKLTYNTEAGRGGVLILTVLSQRVEDWVEENISSIIDIGPPSNNNIVCCLWLFSLPDAFSCTLYGVFKTLSACLQGKYIIGSPPPSLAYTFVHEYGLYSIH